MRVPSVVALAIAALGAAPVLSAPAAVPPSQSAAAGPTSFKDLTPLGFFLMPNGVDTVFSTAAITGRVVAGKAHLFINGTFGQGGPLLEIAPPTTFAPFDAQFAGAPRATLIKNWGTAPWGKVRKSWTADGVEQNPIRNLAQGQMHWHEGQQRLFFTFYNNYNATAQEEWNLASVALEPEISTAGPWRTAARVGSRTAYGPERGFFLAEDPRDGALLISSTLISNNKPYPWGPNLYSIPSWPTATTPSGFGKPDLRTTKVYVDHPVTWFKNGQPPGSAPNWNGWTSFKRRHNIVPFEPLAEADVTADPAKTGGISSWQEVDLLSGFAAFQDVVFFFANLTGTSGVPVADPKNCKHGHTWYNNLGAGRRDAHGCVDPLGNTGPTYTDHFAGVYTYRRSDLDQVASGKVQPHKVEPFEFTDLGAIGVRMNPAFRVGDGKMAVYVDRTNRRLYALVTRVEGVMQNGADWNAVVWVWRY